MKNSSHHKPVRDENSTRSLREDHRDKRSLEQTIEDSFKYVPQKEWDKLPHDLTDRLDHYLYGTER